MPHTSAHTTGPIDTEPANPLRDWFDAHEGRQINKWLHYLDVYDRHFGRFRGTDVHIVEIGVANGGSLQMWKDYFGPDARIFGVDMHERLRAFEDEQVSILIGDQADRGFLRRLADVVPRIDILLDDGGHTMRQQIVTFEELYSCIEPTGIYVCEDSHTSYWRKYGGGYHRRGTFVEYAKNWIDKLHAWHTPESRPPRLDDFTRSTASIHWYDSIVVLEKAPIQPPVSARRGVPPDAPAAGPPRPKSTIERARARLASAVGAAGDLTRERLDRR